MEFFIEQSKKLNIIDSADVVVIGGGPAGVAAATSAAVEGMTVIIVEANGFFGGANVGGYSATIGGLFNSTPDESQKEQIVYGFAGRFADELEEKKGFVRAERFGHTWLSPHDPFVWKETADKFITNAGVKTYFHTFFVDSIVEDNEIKGVIIENKDGRSVITGKVFIDTSGDGDLAVRSGADFVFGKNGTIQSMTMTFRMTNVDWKKYGSFQLEDVWELASKAVQTGKYNLPRLHPFIFRAPNAIQAIMNATSIVAHDKRTLLPTKTADLTEAEFTGRSLIREYERFAQDYIPGFENAYVLDTASQIGIRQSRSIVCDYTLKNEDVAGAKKFETAIARSAWPIEIHLGAAGVKIVNLDDEFYQIPYECLIPKGFNNLLVAGRCISAEYEALASCRVVAQCMEEGFAAGVASSLMVKNSVDSRNISVAELQKIMRSNGANI